MAQSPHNMDDEKISIASLPNKTEDDLIVDNELNSNTFSANGHSLESASDKCEQSIKPVEHLDYAEKDIEFPINANETENTYNNGIETNLQLVGNEENQLETPSKENIGEYLI